MKKKTWEFVFFFVGRKLISTKWAIKIKRKAIRKMTSTKLD